MAPEPFQQRVNTRCAIKMPWIPNTWRRITTLAADRGNQDAQLLLGQTYMEGLPELPRDPVQGGMWLRLAAKDNLPFYATQLAAAERVMSPEQRAQGKALAAAWQPQPGLAREASPSSSSCP